MSKKSATKKPAVEIPESVKNTVLNSVIAKIQHTHGSDAITTLDGSSMQKLPKQLSSGSLTLDLNLGPFCRKVDKWQYGFAEGRICEIYGGEAGGKCLTADSMLHTAYGLLTVRELFELHAHRPATCTNRTEEHHHGLLNENGNIEETSHFTWNNRRKVFKLKTASGFTLRGTANHPVRVMDKSGYVVWRQLSNIATGDHVILARGILNNAPACGDVNIITHEMAGLIGYLIADGAMKDTYRVSFSNSDPDVINEFETMIATVCDYQVKSHVHSKCESSISHYVYSKGLRKELAEKYGLEYVLAAGKSVPLCVRQGSRAIQVEFLRSYIELECSVDPDERKIEVTSASLALLQTVQLMLLSLGIVSSVNPKEVKDYGTYHRLLMCGDDFNRYLGTVDFKTTARRNKVANCARSFDVSGSIPHMASLFRSLQDALTSSSRATNDITKDVISGHCDLTYRRLDQVISHIEESVQHEGESVRHILGRLYDLRKSEHYYDLVSSVDYDGDEPTFDVVMPHTHSFVAGGIINHNTSLTLHMIANCQRFGGQCAFIDAEHALDPNWARRLGVKLDQLLFSQPQSGEQALQIVEDLVKTNTLDMIVVDSVDALVPQCILDGEVGDQTMGKHAAMMSKSLRRITMIKSKTLVVFINQIREKVGVVFGNPETTPGGRALKFYASYRLDVRKGAKIMEGELNIGHRMTVKTIKNKLSPPFAVAEFDFLYDLRPDLPVGIDKVGELLDLSESVGLVERSGAWYNMGNVRLGQGRRNAITNLRADPTTMWNLFNEMMTRKLAQRGYTPDLVPLPGMPTMPMAGVYFELPTAEDLANAAGQDDELPIAA